MSLPHFLNLVVHVLVGMAAMAVGLMALKTPGSLQKHRRLGRIFVALTLVVCLTALIGNAVFRFMPLFAVLTLLVSYQLLSGWHVIYTRAAGPNLVDAGLLLCAATIAMMLANCALAAGFKKQDSLTVIVSSLATLAMLLLYDAARWMFPKRWHALLWRYEHIYKIVASLFAMLSAAVGNTVRAGQPWSQLAPSVVGLAVIAWCLARNYRAQQRVTAEPG